MSGGADRLRVGITLPQFRSDLGPALEVAAEAEGAGLDGVFVFDHLWPIGRPDRPALGSVALLGALAARTREVHVGTLVARVGLVPDAVLVNELVSVDRVSGGRLIAGLGTGDSLNRGENRAYGVAFAPAAERIEALVRCCRALRATGVRTWAGGRSPALRRAAVAAPADGWNAWGASPRELAADGQEVVAGGVELTWSGQVLVAATREDAEAKAAARPGGVPSGALVGDVADLADRFGALADAGATWAVCAPLDVGDDPAVRLLVAAAAKASKRARTAG